MMFEALLVTLAAAAATLVGGFLAFRLRTRLAHLAAFGAGSLVAVALLDLIPEALHEHAEDAPAPMLFAALGFLTFYVAERFALFHAHDESEAPHEHTRVGVLGAAGVTIHSLLDGLALGLAFQASAAVGAVVGLAVALHKLADGTSTVTLILTSGHAAREALRWLLLAALAPLLGLLLSTLLPVSEELFPPFFGFFAGSFLYLGASHLLPEAHHAQSGRAVAVATIAGFALVFLAGQLFEHV